MGWQVVYVPFLFAGNSIINQQGFYVYSSTPAFGDLIASILSQAGTDQFNNPTQAGITSYVTIAGTTYAIGLNALSGTGLPGLSMGDINHPPTAVAGFFGEASSAVGTPQAFAAITSGQATGPDVASFISVLSQVQSSVNGGQIVLQAGDVQHDLGGNLIDYTSTTTGSPLVTQTSGDGNVYHFGQAVVRDNGVPHLINSTTPIITLTSPNLLAGKGYHIWGFAVYLGGQATGAAVFSWGAANGLTLGTQQNGWQDFEGGGAAPPIRVNNGALGAAVSPVFGSAATNWLYRFDVYVNVVNTGNLVVNAAENNAGLPFTIGQAYMRIEEF